MTTAMVVDDEPTILRLLSLVLRGMGCDSMLAADAEGALEQMLDRRPDLIIADVRLPGMDGVQFTRRVKAYARLADVPPVLISAFGEPRVDDAHGADRFLPKPFDLETLEDTVKAFVNSK